MENPPRRPTPDATPDQHAKRPDQHATPRPAGAAAAADTVPVMSVFSDQFDPEYIEVVSQLELIWKAGGESGDVSTATTTDPPREYPLFGGTTGIYTIAETGTTLPVNGNAEGDYYIYLGRTIGGTVRGRINVKRTR